MKLSYTAIWEDNVAMLRSHGSLIAALAGVFLFLPALLVHEFAVTAPMQGAPADLTHAVAAMQAYMAANWPLLLLARLAELVGSVAILQLLLGPRGTSVGGAIVVGAMLLPTYFIAFLVSNFAIIIGFFLLIVPGVYLMGRLMVVAPVIVAEGCRNPFTAIARSFALTAANGWSLAGLMLLIGIAVLVVSAVATNLFGILFVLLAGKALGAFLTAVVAAALAAAVGAMLLGLYAATYRRLTQSGVAEAFE